MKLFSKTEGFEYSGEVAPPCFVGHRRVGKFLLAGEEGDRGGAGVIILERSKSNFLC
jgi:hypothetical protein